jgi:hypothetical protein
MFERLETWLKCACILLAVLILIGVVRATLQGNPLAHVVVPSPPTLPADTNNVAPAKGTNQPGAKVADGTNLTNSANSALTGGKATNVTDNVASKTGTNQVAGSQTNPASAVTVLETNKLLSTNELADAPKASSSAEKTGSTNSAVVLEDNDTNKPATNAITSGAGVPPALSTATNSASNSTSLAAQPVAGIGQTNPVVGTNGSPLLTTATNAASNAVVTSTADAKTNGPPGSAPHGRKAKSGMPPEMASMMAPGGPGAKLPELSPALNARIDKITDSEILAPVMRPQPMALLGIAGNVAFLRSPSGQTGLLKESETLGELKLLRIGINRVLVEQDGQKKELTIFSGYGGDSLLPKTNTTNEPAK